MIDLFARTVTVSVLFAAAAAASQSQERVAGPVIHQFSRATNPSVDGAADGSAIAFLESVVGDRYSRVWVREASGGEPIQLPGQLEMSHAFAAGFMRPRWSPDGARLAYIAHAAGEARLHVWNRATRKGESFDTRIACLETCVEYSLQWAPDSSAVYYLAINEAVRRLHPDVYLSGDGQSLAERRRLLFSDPANGGVTVRAHPKSKNAAAGKPLSDVVAAFVGRNEVATVLTGADVNKIVLAPDGRKLLAIATSELEPNVRQAYQDFYVIDPPRGGSAVGSDAEKIRDWRGATVEPAIARTKQFYVGQGSWSPDSRLIAYAEQGALADGDVFVFDVARRSKRNLTAALRLPPQFQDLDVSDPAMMAGRNFAYAGKFGEVYRAPVWSRDGKKLFVTRAPERRLELWEVPLSNGAARSLTARASFGVTEILHRNGIAVSAPNADVVVSARFDDDDIGFVSIKSQGPGTSTLMKVSGLGLQYPRPMVAAAFQGHTVAFTNETTRTPENVFTLDLRSMQVRQLTNFNDEVGKRDPGEWRTVSWKRPDGEERHALLHLPPAAARPAAPALPPVIMTVYPTDSARTPRIDQYAGLPDLYSAPLTELLHAGYAILTPSIAVKPGGGACVDAAEETVRALEAAGATGTVDISRAGITGFSFGGWTVNCVVTQTDRFKAAVSGAGIADMFSMAFMPDQSVWALGGGQTNINESLWTAPELYRAESPVFGSPKASTPLLLVHGKDDVAVPVEQSIEMYMGLVQQDKPVTMALYDGRGHDNLTDSPDYRKRVIEWFERHLRGKE